MREQLQNQTKASQRCCVRFSWEYVGIENNAMFIIVNIRGVLEVPLTAVDGDRE